MPDTTILSDLGCQIVLERIAELAGCLEDTAEERELIELHQAVAIWENKRWKDACAAL